MQQGKATFSRALSGFFSWTDSTPLTFFSRQRNEGKKMFVFKIDLSVGMPNFFASTIVFHQFAGAAEQKQNNNSCDLAMNHSYVGHSNWNKQNT